ncbi:hypothetical protein ACFXA3_03160 [Streptomyces sp. NPDC059456]|uniref:hypothetical protein n=1 Tax=Streptomyces sp. NPDC059456 TaxID=3346838 RepID=UPI0036A9EEDB
METNANATNATSATTTDPVLLDTPGARAAFASTRAGVRIYGALTAAALLTVVAVAVTGHMVNPFMWVRAILLPLIAVLLHRLTVSVFQGSRRAFERLRGISAVFPVAIVGVDLIPGVCPWWYAALQALCVLPVIRIALTMRGTALRTAFPKTR